MKKIKKMLCVALVLLLMVASVPVTVFAEEPEYETEQNLSYSANNAIGNTLLSAMEDTNEQTSIDNGFGIFGVNLNGFVADVSLSAPDNATVIVAVYDEDTDVMVTSGQGVANSDTGRTTVNLKECELPDYYIIKVFIINSSNIPVCEPYTNEEYTRAYEEFFAKTVYDFDEEQVMNFDISDEDNFAVVSDDSIIISKDKKKNIVVTDDYENGIYVFENADNDIKSLKNGDILYYVYGDGADEYILTKVGKVETSDGLTTVTAAEECEIGELFSYIDIDTSKMEMPQTYGASFDDDGGQLDDERSFGFGGDVVKEGGGSHFSYKMSMNGKLTFNLKFYYDFRWFGKDYYNFEYWVGVEGHLSATVTATTSGTKKVNLVDRDIPVFWGIDIHVEFDVTIKWKAAITVTGTADFTMKNGASRESGGIQRRIEQKPTVKLNLDIEGNYSFSIIPELRTGFKVLKVYHVTLIVPVDFNTSGKLYVPTSSEEYQEHSCSACVSGMITATPSLTVDVKFGIRKNHLMDIINITPLSKTYKLGKYYISLNGGVKFGWGNCPNNSSNTGNSGSGNSDYDDSGFDSSYLWWSETGSGLLGRWFSGGSAADSMIPERNVVAQSKLNISDPSKFLVGALLGWKLYEDGELVIYNMLGTNMGLMLDFLNSGTMAPWYEYRDQVKYVTIDEGVKNIGAGAFNGCDSIVSVIIPNSVNEIGDAAFYGCEKLEEISIPDSVTELGYAVFAECDNLKRIKLPSNLNKIGDATFYNCANLTEVDIPDGVTDIGYAAFGRCSNLAKADLPSNLRTVGEAAFAECIKLTEINLPDKLTSVGNMAFATTAIKNISIPKNLSSIGQYAFITMAIEGFSVSEQNNYFSTDSSGVLFNKNKTQLLSYPWAKNDETYTVPATVKTIADGGFYGATNLKKVVVSEGVKTIGEMSFILCEGLTEIELPYSLETIGAYAFAECTNLGKVTYPGKEAMWQCINIGEGNEKLTDAQFVYGDKYNVYKSVSEPEDLNYNIQDNEENIAVVSIFDDLEDIINGGTNNSTPESKEDEIATITKTIKSVVPGYVYFLLVVKDGDAEDLLSADNLIYIDQKVADSENLKFTFTLPKESMEHEIVIYYADLNALNHIHSYAVEVSKEATHLENGEATLKCSCGEMYIVVIDKAEEHFYVPSVTKEATHLEAGEMTYSCECGDYYTEEIEKIDEHTYTSTVIKQPTHTEKGIKTFKCICGDSYTEMIEKLEEHTYTSSITKQPNHLERGIRTFSCACGDSYTENMAKLEEHTYISSVTKEPTHLENGVTTFTCACGDTYTETIEKLKEHTFGDKDEKCECGFDRTEGCSCNCHKGGISGFFFKIILFFQKIFKSNQVCMCGIKHY